MWQLAVSCHLVSGIVSGVATWVREDPGSDGKRCAVPAMVSDHRSQVTRSVLNNLAECWQLRQHLQSKTQAELKPKHLR